MAAKTEIGPAGAQLILDRHHPKPIRVVYAGSSATYANATLSERCGERELPASVIRWLHSPKIQKRVIAERQAWRDLATEKLFKKEGLV